MHYRTFFNHFGELKHIFINFKKLLMILNDSKRKKVENTKFSTFYFNTSLIFVM